MNPRWLYFWAGFNACNVMDLLIKGSWLWVVSMIVAVICWGAGNESLRRFCINFTTRTIRALSDSYIKEICDEQAKV
jgi:hypothetical protein